jgi:predicted Zn-dependent protease
MRCFLVATIAASALLADLGASEAQTQRRSIERDRGDATTTGPGPQDRGESGTVVRGRLLDQLFEGLAKAQTAEEAAPFDAAISEVFRRTGSPTVDMLMGWAREAIGRNETGPALDYIEGLLAIAPDTLDAYFLRGVVRLQRRELSGAMADMERVLQLEPRHYGAMGVAASILRETGRQREAFRMLEMALRVHPQIPNGRRTLDALRPTVEGRPS